MNNQEKQLKKVSMSIPKDLVKKALVSTDVHAEQRDNMERMRKNLQTDNRYSSSQKREADKKLGRMLENPKLYEKRGEVNKQAERQIEKHVEGKVNAAIHRGDLPKPKMDAWMKEKAEKIRRRGW